MKKFAVLPLVVLVAACAATSEPPAELAAKSQAVHLAYSDFRLCSVREGAIFARSHRAPARDIGITAVGRCGAQLQALRNAVAQENAGRRSAEAFADTYADEIREREVDEVAALVMKARSRSQR
jgi:hypothetical protein